MATKDPYKVLGVDPDASMEDIKKAYRAMAKKYHPDRHNDPVAKEMAEEKMAEINAAYDAIESGEAKRQRSQSSQSGYNPFGDQWPFGSSASTGPNTQGQNPWQHQQSWHESRTYRQSGPANRGGSSCCDQLCCLCMADSCCECMGGDLCTCM